METISITIPREKEALIKTADYLRSLAGVETAQTVIPIVEVILDPQKEADDMGDRIDRTVAAAAAPAVEVPAIPPAAPAVEVPAIPPAAGLEVDSEGAPWDVRIHSGGKTFMQSGPKIGTWKLKKGVDPALLEQVKAELLAAPAEVLNIPAVATDEQGYAIAPAAALPPVEAPVVVVVAPAAALPTVEIPPAAAIVPVTTYTELITFITDQSKPGGVLQANDVKDAIKASGAGMHGVITLPELAPAQHIAYIPLVADELRKIWATRA